jgi:hypothetical protein
MDIFERLLTSWRLSASLHQLSPGATSVRIQQFEGAVGWHLPAEWRGLYLLSDGGSLLEGNLTFYPLDGADLSLRNASTAHRAWEWPVPAELWLAGDNGAGEPFGLWLPAATDGTAPVVSIGQIFEPECLAVAGSSLLAFLLARTAYYLLLCEAPSEALDAIGLPLALRAKSPDDDTWLAIGRWADPARPGSSDDPYSAALDAPAANALLVSAA